MAHGGQNLAPLSETKGASSLQIAYRPIQITQAPRQPQWKPYLLRVPGWMVTAGFALGLIVLLEYLVRIVPHFQNPSINSDVESVATHFWKRQMGSAAIPTSSTLTGSTGESATNTAAVVFASTNAVFTDTMHQGSTSVSTAFATTNAIWTILPTATSVGFTGADDSIITQTSQTTTDLATSPGVFAATATIMPESRTIATAFAATRTTMPESSASATAFAATETIMPESRTIATAFAATGTTMPESRASATAFTQGATAFDAQGSLPISLGPSFAEQSSNTRSSISFASQYGDQASAGGLKVVSSLFSTASSLPTGLSIVDATSTPLDSPAAGFSSSTAVDGSVSSLIPSSTLSITTFPTKSPAIEVSSEALRGTITGRPSQTTTFSDTRTITVTALFGSQNPYYNRNLSLPECSTGTCVFDVRYPAWAFVVPLVVPVTIAVIFKTLWTCMHNSLRQLEPFALLTRPGGSRADHSMCEYYLARGLLPDFVPGMFRGRFLLSWSSIVLTLAGILPSLAAEMLFSNTKGCPAELHSSNSANPCAPELNIDIGIARTIQALLGFVVLATLVLATAFHRRKNGYLSSDPSSIVTIASLSQSPDLQSIFRSVPSSSSSKQLHEQLREQHFRLGLYHSPDGTERYGIYPCNVPILFNQTDGDSEHPRSTQQRQRQRQNTPTKTRLLNCTYELLIGSLQLGLLIIIVIYYLDASDSPFNRFFNSSTFGPRFILTSVASVLAMQWTSLFLELDNKSIYRRLAQGDAPASKTILVGRSSTALTGIVPAVLRGSALAAAVAALAILAEVLVIVIPSVPFGSGRLWGEFRVCTYISMGVLSLMMVGVGGVVYWRWRLLPYLPREPTTIADVVSYVVESGGLRDCTEGLEFASKKEAYMRLRNSRWRYGCGLASWEREVWKIDEMERWDGSR